MDASFRSLNASIGFDRRLFQEDIESSRAWNDALCRSGLISDEDSRRIGEGLEQVQLEIESGQFVFSEELEDIHMNIEGRLTELVGEPAARLHTGRSRNDQVATDLRLHLRDQSEGIARDLLSLIDALVDQAELNFDVVIPAYTHLQRGQPVLFAHHLLAYAEMFLRDHGRFTWAADQADSCPLGSGACAGNQFGIDRDDLQRRLGFARMTHNSLDAVSDRDFACDFLHACVLFLVHVSRLGMDLILWSSSEFGFVELDESVASGSSMLPQKKNPDACELGRAKCGRTLGHLVALVTTLKGLPLSYNKDLQEDKEGTFDAADTVNLIIPVFDTIVGTLVVNRRSATAALEGGHIDAISVADYLTRKGVPFRQAHERSAEAVRTAQSRGTSLASLSIEEYRAIHRAFDVDLFDALSVTAALENKDVVGGTAPRRVRAEIVRLRDITKRLREEKMLSAAVPATTSEG
jgi:argininosuccinate lyase